MHIKMENCIINYVAVLGSCCVTVVDDEVQLSMMRKKHVVYIYNRCKVFFFIYL
jgi:hypothetical protein